jgi:acetyl-CoA synthetase
MADAIASNQTNIDSILDEQRKFECPSEFAQKAHLKSLAEYEALYQESVEEPEKFWGRAAEEWHWFKKWDKVLEWNCPWAKWFGANQSFHNCSTGTCKRRERTRRPLKAGKRTGEVRTLHPLALEGSTEILANVMKSLGIRKGDWAFTWG